MVNVGVEAVHHTQVEAVSVQNVAAQGGVGAGFEVVGRVVGVLLWGSVRWCRLLFWLAGCRLRSWSWGWLIVLPEIIIIFVIIPKVIITSIIIPKVVTMFIILKIVLLILSDRYVFINDLNLFFFLFRFNNNSRFRLNFRSRLRWCDGLFLIFVPPVFPGVCLHSKQSY